MRVTSTAVKLRVGATVKQLRLRRGLSQEKLAELVGNEVHNISDVENGKANVTLDILIKIATSLAVPVGDLFGTGPRRGQFYVFTQREMDQLVKAARVIERAGRPRTERRKLR